MFNWLRRMLGPCEACEALKDSLAIERSRVTELMKIVIPNNKPTDIISARSDEQPKQPFIPWKVRREMLEREDRERAKIIQQNKTTEELEKEVGI